MFAIEIGDAERETVANLLNVDQSFTVRRAGGHAAAVIRIRDLTTVRPVFLHAVELEDAISIGMADDDFAQRPIWNQLNLNWFRLRFFCERVPSQCKGHQTAH